MTQKELVDKQILNIYNSDLDLSGLLELNARLSLLIVAEKQRLDDQERTWERDQEQRSDNTEETKEQQEVREFYESD